ncbi:MAG: hypothetical protein ACREHC_00560, partial [Candidatus Levyibacteriota bacterium]
LNSTQHAPPVSAAPKIVHVTWAPYTDNAHNFSLEYPSTWTVDMTASNAQFVLRKKDEKGTYIYFSYSPTNVSFTKQPNASVRETLLVGKKPLVFTDYFTGLGEQTAAYADLRTALLGGSIYTIVINLDVNDTAGDTITVKKILASLKPLK